VIERVFAQEKVVLDLLKATWRAEESSELSVDFAPLGLVREARERKKGGIVVRSPPEV
jgi:hypothetical protein